MTRVKWLLMLLLLALLAMQAFRPRPRPVQTRDFRVEPAGLAAQAIHELRHRDSGGNDEYLLRNLIAGPIEANCDLADAQNVQAVPPLPRRLVVPALSELQVTSFRAVDAARSGGAAITCAAVPGDPGARPRAGYIYALPFLPGTAYRLDQGFGGVHSHHDVQSRYALDLSVADGTPVLVARSGVVMQVEQAFRGHGADPERYGGRANFVRIVHDDGSMALYAHLSAGSVLVRPGDRVGQGQLLGKSGNTGLSTGPHLHFSVQANTGMQLRAIPFAMVGVDTGPQPRDAGPARN
jgi:murein DD-endopeptidase MepM/ murein hydrolase activator NlpD